MVVYLCEKPSQAKDIAAVLGADRKQNGFITSDKGITVTWCFGHLLEMAMPDEYGEQYQVWSVESLPINPGKNWKFKVKKSAAAQVKVVVSLLKQADEVVIATDADREGEVIAREMLDYAQYRGNIKRLWLSALDRQSIEKALASLKEGRETAALYQAGLARSRADWLVGMNLTRLFTCIGRQSGHKAVYSVGRVQTPTLKLVVDRDRIRENFQPHDYFELFVVVDDGSVDDNFSMKWQPFADVIEANSGFFDEARRCTHKAFLEGVAEQILAEEYLFVSKSEKVKKSDSAPLPYCLSDLQQEASARLGMDVQKTLDIAQSLYEKWKLTTYPRTDCRFLPESQFAEAQKVCRAMVQTDPDFEGYVQIADLKIKSGVWNDSKVTAHHAIIPTGHNGSVSELSEEERLIYDLIRRRYLAQFYPDFVYEQSTLELECDTGVLVSKGKRIIDAGWRVLFSEKSFDETVHADLDEGDEIKMVSSEVKQAKTKPPKAYTQGTLIAAMKNIARVIQNPEQRKMLNEHAGIGTEATRANIINALIDRKLVMKKGKTLLSTEQGRALIKALPDEIMDPATTALWEQSLEAIENGKMAQSVFLESQNQWIRAVIDRSLEQKADLFQKQKRDYEKLEVGKHCPKCKKGTIVRKTFKKGKYAGNPFLGCDRFPRCKVIRF